MKTIAIQCTAAVNLNLADLTPLQGGLKELSDASFEKLKQSILKHGITFPFFVWQSEDENYILDGTQRDRVLKRMAVDDGYDIPPLPCALIEAKNRQQAAEKILLISSQYGKMSNHSLEDFLAENDLDLSELQDELELPSIDLEFFGDADFDPVSAGEQGRLDKKNPVICPECGHEFVP
jgi:ParB-like chromosome segregation protein Spo0J